MERNLLIELLEDGEKVSLYSPRFEGEDYTEFEKFLLQYMNTYPKDVQVLIRRERQQIVTIQGTNLNGPLSFTIDD